MQVPVRHNARPPPKPSPRHPKMETPPQRASLDLHRAAGDVALGGDALENVHQLVQAQQEGAGQSTGPSEAVSETGTVSYKGKSHPVAASEAADLLAWLDEREGGLTGPDARAASCLRRVAGCVPASLPSPAARRFLGTTAGPVRGVERAGRGWSAACLSILVSAGAPTTELTRTVPHPRRLVNSDKSRTSIDEEDSFNAVAALLARFRASRTEAARVSVLDSPNPAPAPSQLTLDLAAEGKKGLPTVKSGVTVEDMLLQLNQLAGGDPDTPARSEGDETTGHKADESFASEEGEEGASPTAGSGRLKGNAMALMRGLSKRFTNAGESIANVVENALNKLDAGAEGEAGAAEPTAAAPSAVEVQ